MPRAISILLGLTILVGGVLVIRAQTRLSHLQREYQRLTAIYGTFEIKDPDKFYLKQLVTENEKDFLWRIHTPPGLDLIDHIKKGIGSHAQLFCNTEDGGESLLRCGLFMTDSGFEAQLISEVSTRSCSGLNKQYSDFLDEHWNDLEIATINDGEYPADEVMQLLTIRIPPCLLYTSDAADE